ncbi:MAG: carboxypeptidase regulatory-like domain-containing protein [Planctomycetes bacterium]|nr:carboxypeptidase regulatory-like domain-containing protein [Planctomycetota bacterium]
MRTRAVSGLLCVALAIACGRIVGAKDPPRGSAAASEAVFVRGRAVDVKGQPVLGAMVRVWKRGPTTPFPVLASVEQVQFAERRAILTGEEGWFETPALEADVAICITVEKEGMLTGRSRVFKPGAIDRPPLDRLVLRRLAEIEGRVVDRAGQAVAGATVFQSGNGPWRTETVTDREGKFRLSDVPEGEVFVFATHKDFRFHGQLIDTSAGPSEIKLVRKDETPTPMKALTPLMSHAEELELALRVAAPHWKEVMQSGDDRTKMNVSSTYARLDPWKALDEVGEQLKHTVFVPVILPLLYAADSEEALALLEAQERDAADKAGDLLRILRELPGLSRSRKLDLLDRALRHARSITTPDSRIMRQGEVVETLLDLGESERAKQLAEELQALAEQLPSMEQDARGLFAEAICHFDLQRALNLIADLEDVDEFERWHFRLARRIAANCPATAEQLVQAAYERVSDRIARQIETQARREPVSADLAYPRTFCEVKTVAVCYSMAAADSQRAHRLALRIRNPYQRAYALGMIAKALAITDQPRARQLIQDAYALLAESARVPDRQWNTLLQSAPKTAAALLPVVEEIDPTLVPEHLWQALSFRMHRPVADFFFAEQVEQSESYLAVWLARYDRELAKATLHSSRVLETAEPGRHAYDWAVVTIALVEPERVLEAVGDDPKANAGARRTVVEILSAEGARRWNINAAKSFLWIPDRETWNAYSGMFW